MTKVNKSDCFAVLQPAEKPTGELPYKKFHEKHAAWKFHTIVLDLRFYGASKLDADQAAKWCRTAKAGESRIVDPGIEIRIVMPEEEKQ